VWDEEGTAVPVGRAATYTPPRHVVTASARSDLYLDMLEWAHSEAKTLGACDIDEKALRAIVEDESGGGSNKPSQRLSSFYARWPTTRSGGRKFTKRASPMRASRRRSFRIDGSC
jgi:hypothetical protein